jgi:hypothetical protein
MPATITMRVDSRHSKAIAWAMKLPGGAKALVEERKIRSYLLNLEHPDGLAKARFFMSRGYRADD